MFLRLTKPQLPGYNHKPVRSGGGLRSNVTGPRLSCGFLRACGRSNTGSRTVFSKGSRAYHPKFKLLFWPTAGFFSMGLVTTLLYRGLFSGILLLVRTAAGAWFQTPATAKLGQLEHVQAVSPALFGSAWLHARSWW
jgi:hypothetical protein